jgi:serine/threonine protein kinase
VVVRLILRDTVYSPGQKIGGYTVRKVSGEGRYGICYLVSDDQQQYILKQLKRDMLKKSKAKAGFEQEILSSLNHKSIPRFIGKVEDKGLCGYLLEYKEGETFEDLIYSEDRVFLQPEIHHVGRQLISIIKYLHESGIVHRDIRVPNTLYHERTVCLVDFGLARWVDNLRYNPDIDYAYLGDFLLHLYYTSFETNGKKKKPWHEELDLREAERLFLKRLLGMEKKFRDIYEVEHDFQQLLEIDKGRYGNPGLPYHGIISSSR